MIAKKDSWNTYTSNKHILNAKGVPVSIDAIDPNGNLVHLGDVTSDAKVASIIYKLIRIHLQLGQAPTKLSLICRIQLLRVIQRSFSLYSLLDTHSITNRYSPTNHRSNNRPNDVHCCINHRHYHCNSRSRINAV